MDPVAPVNVTPPAINGTAAAGQALACVPGAWTGAPEPTYAHQWMRDGVAIAGATATGYTTTAADVGTSVTCRETASNVAGAADATSAPLALPAPAAVPTPAPTAAPTPTPTPVPATPEEKLAGSSPSQVATAFSLPSARKCVSRRNFTIRLRSPRGVTIAKAAVTVGTRKLRVRKVSGRFVATVDLRGLPRGRFTVKIRIVTARGSTLRGSRRYRTCAPRRR